MRVSTKAIIASLAVLPLILVLSYLVLIPRKGVFYFALVSAIVVVADYIGRVVAERAALREVLEAARPVERIVSIRRIARQIALVSIILAGVAGPTLYLIYGTNTALRVLATVFLGGVVLPALLAFTYPKFVAGLRASGVEKELSFLILYLRVLAESPMPPDAILVSLRESTVFRRVAEEIRIALDIAQRFGLSLLTALRLSLRYHPSKLFRKVFERIVSAAESTGNLRTVLDLLATDVSEREIAKIYSSYENLTVLYSLLVLLLPVLPALGVVAGVTGGGLSLTPVQYLLIVVLVALLMSILAAGLVPTIAESRPRGYLLASSSLSIATGLFLAAALYNRLSPVQLAILLSTASVPGSLASLYSSWLEKSYEEAISHLVDAVSATAHIGEDLIHYIERRYREGQMPPIMRDIVTALRSPAGLFVVLKKLENPVHRVIVEAISRAYQSGADPVTLTKMTLRLESLKATAYRLRSLASTFEVMSIVAVFIAGFTVTFLSASMSSISSIAGATLASGSAGMPIGVSLHVMDVGSLEAAVVVSVYAYGVVASYGRYKTFAHSARLLPVYFLAVALGLIAGQYFASIIMPST